MEPDPASTDQPDASRARPTRGLWIRNTKGLLGEPSQIDRLLEIVEVVHLTDVYMDLASRWYEESSASVAAVNARLHTAGVQAWAVSGDRADIETLPSEDTYISALTRLGDFNDSVESNARFHGLLVNIDPEDDGTYSGFRNGIPDSRLDAEQYVQRDVVLHQWINVLTRASNLMHSYDMQFGAVVPHRLLDCGGEPVTVSWVSNASTRTGVLDLIQPLVDELVVSSGSTDVAGSFVRVEDLVRYATTMATPGKSPPRVLGAIEPAEDRYYGRSENVHGEAQHTTAVLDAVRAFEAASKTDSIFGGTLIHYRVPCDTLQP